MPHIIFLKKLKRRKKVDKWLNGVSIEIAKVYHKRGIYIYYILTGILRFFRWNIQNLNATNYPMEGIIWAQTTISYPCSISVFTSIKCKWSYPTYKWMDYKYCVSKWCIREIARWRASHATANKLNVLCGQCGSSQRLPHPSAAKHGFIRTRQRTREEKWEWPQAENVTQGRRSVGRLWNRYKLFFEFP